MKYTNVSQETWVREKNQRKSKGTWQPWTLSATFLFSFLILCILLAVFVEVLLRASDKSQGFIFSDSGTTNFVFNYLPTIIAIAFSLLWATANHDYMRLEPFFQLSKPEGATAEHSLLLDYSYTFPHVVLWIAAKRGHITVLFSLIMTLLIVVVMVPIMSGLFDEKAITRIRDTEVLRLPLYSIEDQEKFFSTEFSNLAYSHTWLNGSLPGFTTSEYALSPFGAKSSDFKYHTNETWVGETVLYEAAPNCKPADITTLSTGPGYTGPSYNISNGNGCYYYLYDWLANLADGPKLGIWENSWTGLFIGNVEDYPISVPPNRTEKSAYIDDYLHMTGCTNTNTFLAIWGSSRGQANKTTVSSGNFTQISQVDLPENFTAVFCEPTFYSESVKAIVQMPEGAVLNVTRLGDRKLFTQFNASKFEYFTTIGGISQLPSQYDSQGKIVSLDYIPAEMPEVDYQLAKRFGARSGTIGAGFTYTYSEVYALGGPLGGFALYNRTNETLPGLLDPNELAMTYSEAFKTLFAFAVTAGLTDLNSTAGIATPVTRDFKARVFVMNTLWSRLAQGGFGVLSILTIGLLITTWGRRTNLDMEPNSLASGLALLAESSALIRDLYNSEYHDQEELHKVLAKSTRRYQLVLIPGKGPSVQVLGPDSHTLLPPVPLGLDSTNSLPFKPKQPWKFKVVTGVAYFVTFGAMLGFLVYLYFYDKNHDGLPTVARPNSIVYKILFSYLPTIVGISIGPLWETLGAYACMVGPYEALHRGRAPSSKSLTLDYDKSPPHFQLIQAFKAGNPALGTLTIAILLANFLAVALAGLFSPKFVETSIAIDVDRFVDPAVKAGFTLAGDTVSQYQEPYYDLNGNLSGWLSRPSWNTPDYFVLPFNTTTTEEKILIRNGTTIGIGADITCELIPEDKITISQAPVRNSTTNGTTIYNYLTIDNPCWVNELLSSGSTSDEAFATWSTDHPSVNFLMNSVSYKLEQCNDAFFVGWVEHPGDPNPTNFTNPYLDRMDSVVLMCNSTTKAVEMTASIDADNKVVSIDNVKKLPNTAVGNTTVGSAAAASGAYTYTLEDLTSGLLANIIGTDPNIIGQKGLYPLDYETSAQWLNVLLARKNPQVLRNTTNATALPDTTHIVDAFESIYRAIFAINLQLYQDKIFVLNKTERIPGTASVIRERVNISKPMLWMAVGILAYFLLVVLFVFGVQPGKNLSHLPTTLASMHTLLYASNALEECAGIEGETEAERTKRLASLGNTYAYGTFTGRDGREHFGVYRED